ncbi:hypothetical protein Tco_0078601 [Tanacetum coccineum]
MAYRRDLLGLDGAFMKGPFLGHVLAAVGLDSNNGIYPLAYALVEAKMIDKRVSFHDEYGFHTNIAHIYENSRREEGERWWRCLDKLERILV